ncbi:MAG: efflux RND transporter periplasmic adaptor subunit [Myxococcota bacterium]
MTQRATGHADENGSCRKGVGRCIVGLTLCALAASLSACADDSSSASTPKAGESSATKEGRKILYWKSPMDPSFIAQGPGKDSMGMDLVPVYEGEVPSGPPGRIRIDPATVQNIGVRTALVERKSLSREIRTVGRIGYDERLVRRIAPKIAGWIENQTVNFTGQFVTRGQRLLDIYSPELVSTQEEYLVALRYRRRLAGDAIQEAVRGSQDLVQAAETRLRYWGITQAQIKALRERGKITRTMTLHSPTTGIIIEKHVPEGGYIKAGETVYGIADISTIWVYGDVYEYEAPWLNLGQKATMTLAYEPTVTYTGKVTYIYPYLDSKTRTLRVRLEFQNTDDFALKPDMWANVTLHAETTHDALAIPERAVIRTGQRSVALVALDGGYFEPRDVQLGRESGDDVEVLSGVEEGERVVTSAQFLINSESNLQSAIAKMLRRQTAERAADPQTADPSAMKMPGMKMEPAGDPMPDEDADPDTSAPPSPPES